MRVTYRSNNSGGSWWLTDDDWNALEEAGWEVEWCRDREDSLLRSATAKDGRWLGALAMSASKEFDDPAGAITEVFMTGQVAKHRKGTGTIEAMQVPSFDERDRANELELWLGEWFETWLPSTDQIVFRISRPAHGTEVTVSAGDWIAAERDGTGFYPITAGDFAATYEEAP